jgi:hypothetical protein
LELLAQNLDRGGFFLNLKEFVFKGNGGVPITETGFEAVAKLIRSNLDSLKLLTLSNLSITDNTFQIIFNFDQAPLLDNLNLEGNQISSFNLGRSRSSSRVSQSERNIAEVFPVLKYLFLNENLSLNPQAISHIANLSMSLNTIQIRKCGLDVENLKKLLELPNLEEIDISDNKMTDEACLVLSGAAMSAHKIFALHANGTISSAGSSAGLENLLSILNKENIAGKSLDLFLTEIGGIPEVFTRVLCKELANFCPDFFFN